MSDVILAIVNTDRFDAMRRLLCSLRPVEHDEHLHLCVLDNGHAPGVIEEMLSAHQRARVIYPPTPRLPLHRARAALATNVTGWCARFMPEASIWMIDDDMRFDALVMARGRLLIQNVAQARLEQVRAWRDVPGSFCGVVGGVTMDPPIRPDAVLETQLGDLVHNLQRFMRMSPIAPYTFMMPSGTGGDYYYDHARQSRDHLSARWDWIMRGRQVDVAHQCALMFRASCGMFRGQTPFRPLFELGAEVTECAHPTSGGNVLFLDPSMLSMHPYPAIELNDDAYSRRVDMLGACLLTKQTQRPFVVDPRLTLLHDRQNQHPIELDALRWIPEFAGVMLHRLLTDEDASPALLDALILRRCERIASSLLSARAHATSALEILAGATPPWWKSGHVLEARLELERELKSFSMRLHVFDIDALKARLRAPSLASMIWRGYEQLSGS